MSKVEITQKEYFAAVGQCRYIFDKKYSDYGTSWRVMRPISLIDQIFIKAMRIRTIQENKDQKIKDNINDEWIGIANYAVIGLIQLQLPSIQKNIDNNRHSAEFAKVLQDIALSYSDTMALYDKYVNLSYDLMLKKNYDYGEAWRYMSQESFTDLILMKLQRMRQIIQANGKTLISEGLDANYFDILNYAIFAIILL